MKDPNESDDRTETTAVVGAKNHPGWLKGPMPPGTWNWGGIQLLKDAGDYCLHFADFRGDHVVLEDGRRVEAEEIGWWNNALDLPPTKG